MDCIILGFYRGYIGKIELNMETIGIIGIISIQEVGSCVDKSTDRWKSKLQASDFNPCYRAQHRTHLDHIGRKIS